MEVIEFILTGVCHLGIGVFLFCFICTGIGVTVAATQESGEYDD